MGTSWEDAALVQRYVLCGFDLWTMNAEIEKIIQCVYAADPSNSVRYPNLYNDQESLFVYLMYSSIEW